MSEKQDERLASLLRRRHAESASANLAERIILRAQSLPQQQNASLWSALRQIFAEYHLPKPGYVLASALILGIVLGFSTAPEIDSQTDTGAIATQSLIASDEELL
jgi:hypothetical protein